MARANYTQRRAVDDKLAEVCVRGDDGLVAYAPGWTDKAVGLAVGVSTATVRYLRLERVGMIKRPPPRRGPPAPAADLFSGGECIGARLAAVEAALAALQRDLYGAAK